MNSSNQTLHELLMDAAIYAATHGRVEKAASIVENIIESAVRKNILIWLQNFTVITTDTVNPQKLKYSKQAKIRWNENKARENPFWAIKLKTRVINAAPNTADTSATPEQTAEYNIEKRHQTRRQCRTNHGINKL